MKGDWETPATFNDTWGYKKNDHNWKPVKDLLYLLADLASKGVNYLLNVGPTGEGEIPKPSVTRLLRIGEWMKVNGEAIYKTSASPFPCEFDWGRMTVKGDKLYLLIMKWRGTLRINGLRNNVKKAYLLADRKRKIGIAQTHDANNDFHTLTLELGGKKTDPYISVVVLELKGAADVDAMPLQQPDGSIVLPSFMAALHGPADDPQFGLSDAGLTQNWHDTRNWVSWSFKFAKAGEYEAKIVISTPPQQVADQKFKVALAIDGKTLKGALRPTEKIAGPRTQYFPESAAVLGKIHLDKPGVVQVELRAGSKPPKDWGGFRLASVRLVPVKK